METAEYFACLNYGSIEILIPQSCICESDYVGVNKMLSEDHSCHQTKPFFIDSYITTLFNMNDFLPDEKIRTHIEIQKSHTEDHKNHFEIHTSLIPTVQRIFWNDVKLLGQDLEEHVASKGIVGFRFTELGIQFVVDPEQLFNTSRPSIKECPKNKRSIG